MDTKSPVIFNLFPRHFDSIDQWSGSAARAADMGFNWVFVNPFHETGFSGSLYAVKDYYRLNPLFLGREENPSDWTPLRRFVEDCRGRGLKVAMDLVINHTAKDAVLRTTHPEWYSYDEKGEVRSPYAVDPDDPKKVTVWGDLAIVNNESADSREELWAYWDRMVSFFQGMGFEGFRCDAAYQVPAPLWQWLIGSAKQRHPETMFLAETLGCSLEEVAALSECGFDFLFNSSKYWRFDEPWCIEQHTAHRRIAPSVSFPESHDTPRLASEKPGTLEMQKNRYVLAAVFSRGLLMPMGYEMGAVTRMDVVKGSPGDVDERRWDLSDWVAACNRWKVSDRVLADEGHWEAISPLDGAILFLRKSCDDRSRSMLFCVNKSNESRHTVTRKEIPRSVSASGEIIRPFTGTFRRESFSDEVVLERSEIVALPEKGPRRSS